MCALFLYSLSYLAILLLIGSVSVYRISVYLGSVIPACLLGVCYCCAWCCVCLVYWCLLLSCVVLVTLSICVIYWLYAVYFVPAGLFLCYLVTLPPCHYYRFISLLFVFICVAGIIYDKAPLKGAYLLVLVLLGWYVYFIFPLLGKFTQKKDNGYYIRYPLII